MGEATNLLVISSDPAFGDVRKDVLEAAGFSVISANNLRQVEDACKQGGFWLVIIGHAIPPKRKKRIWAEIVNRCPGIEILDLYDRFVPNLLEADYYLDAQLGVAAIPKKIKQIQRGKGAAVV
jgi:CheY-like chemotaxis protein